MKEIENEMTSSNQGTPDITVSTIQELLSNEFTHNNKKADHHFKMFSQFYLSESRKYISFGFLDMYAYCLCLNST